MLADKFKHDCYNAYQLDWMISHGYSLDNLYNRAIDCAKSIFDEFDKDDHITDHDGIDRLFMQMRDTFLYEQGFESGEIFASFHEFLDSEFLDPDYMKHLSQVMSIDFEDFNATYEIVTGISLENDNELEFEQ